MNTRLSLLSRVTILSVLLLGSVSFLRAQSTALSAGASSTLQGASSDFEFTSAIGLGQFLYGFQFPGGNTAWTPWTMTGGSGIAAEGSGFLGSQTTAFGDRVAFLQNGGAISCSNTFGRGHWRLRFSGAQRANFGVSKQIVRITVAGAEVFEAELLDTTFRTYTTRPFTFNLATTASVSLQAMMATGDHTAFIDNIELEPLSDWNDATKWSPASVPGTNDDVVIPAGVEMVLRGSDVAATVTVNGELLATFQDATLDTRWVAVSGSNARLEVGQEGTPFTQNFTLTLLGTQPSENAMNAGTAFLMAMDGGTIDMHGSDKTSWTKLASLNIAAVPVGQPPAMELTVDDHTGWAVGDEVVVAYTGHVSAAAGWGPPVCVPNPYQGPRSQQRTITAINPTTGVITLAGTLALGDHCTAPATSYSDPGHPAGWLLDQRAEVGMLTRNVRIRGDTSTPNFGGHVMIMACCTVMPVGLGRFTNIELSNMGQRQKLGRYPMHWHMVRAVRPGNYLRNSSVHACHNRGVTVHGSHDVTVERNVVYDTEGHAMFLEDGVEENNRFLNNLVLGTRKPGACLQMLPHDNSMDQAQNHSPSTFWISNPNNIFVGNVAADSLGTGYWFAVHYFVSGLSSTPTWSGEFPGFAGLNENLGVFTDNVAHSVKMGVDIHDSVQDGDGAKVPQPACQNNPPVYCAGAPSTTPSVSDSTDDDIAPNFQWEPTVQAVLSGLTAYGCTTGIYTGGGIRFTEQVRFDDCVLADNGVHVQFASADTVTNSVLVYDTGHAIYPRGLGINGLDDSYIAGFEDGCAYVVYDGPGRMRFCHLVGYDGSTEAKLFFGFFGAARRHANHIVEGLTFASSSPPFLPQVALPDYTAYNPATSAFAHAFVWGIAIRDTDGCLSSGIPSNPNSPYPTGTPHTLVTNHPMMHAVNASGTADVQTVAMTNAWLSPFPWGHLQVRYYEPGGTFNPGTGCYSQYFGQSGNDLPATRFIRRSYLTWNRVAYTDNWMPGSQMRQIPVIVRTGGSPVAVCEYEVRLDPFLNPSSSAPGRVDISIDDAVAGDEVRLIITHSGLPTTWTPALRINDAPAFIHANGQDPNLLTPLGASPPGAATTYQMSVLGTAPAIDLHLIVPAGQRTHRITITW